MGFPIGEIQRPNLISQGGGFITVTNLLAKIGGQNHFKSSLQVAIPSLTANALYMVYAVLTAPNTPALVISTNPNSVGPVGYTAWDLVGAFYANGMSPVAFGAFVNVDEVPQTSPIPFICVANNFTYSAQTSFWHRDKDLMKMNCQFTLDAVAPTGTLYPNIPANMVIDGTKMNFASNMGNLGGSNGQNGVTAGFTGNLQLGGASRFRTIGPTGNNEWDASIPFTWGVGDTFGVNLDEGVPIVGWSTTPLRKL